MVRSEVCCRRVASQFAARNPAPLVVVDDERPIAFAVALATGSGVIVASSGLLRLLSGPQRAAVLAHEQHTSRRIINASGPWPGSLPRSNRSSPGHPESWRLPRNSGPTKKPHDFWGTG